jgi:hypothetical protein
MDKHNHSVAVHIKPVQKSTTLNRKFVKKMDIAPRRPVKRGYVAPLTPPSSAQVKSPKNPTPITPKSPPNHPAAPDLPPVPHPHVATVNARLAATTPRPLSAQELKDRAIKKALLSANVLTVEQETVVVKHHFWKSKKFFVALTMSAASLALLGYLIHLNLPDLSVRVAAMQTGVDGTYPSYTPRGYSLSGVVTGADHKIEMTFVKDSASFTLAEEKSSWDSAALLSNYVKKEWKNNYITADEQGLRIYISGNKAAWVSGGIFYLITSTGTPLTKQQIHDIAVSL